MSKDRHQEETIFAAALERPTPEARAAYLAEACAGDSALQARVEALLASLARHQRLFEQDPAERLLGSLGLAPGTADRAATLEGPGTVIGRYKLLEQIGEGGFGVVFRAEQMEPVRREVALKVIKAGMDTRQVIARFEAERQALALMDHPNIAKVLDGGVTGGSIKRGRAVVLHRPDPSGTPEEEVGGAAAPPYQAEGDAAGFGASARPYFVM